ncbi:uncharacterized protein LOC144706101 [Wolffia australiana]
MGWGRTGSRTRRRENGDKETLPGCMTGFLQLFRLHQRLFRATATTAPASSHNEALSPNLQEQTPPKGVVAPRNSLKMEEILLPSSSLFNGEEEEEDYDIPMGVTLVLQKNKGNVVARLMGLDHIPYQPPSPKLLREASAATPPLRLTPCNTRPLEDAPRHGTRSLPDTPRASSARKSSDADPRLSLQLPLKENFFIPREDSPLLSSPSPRLAKQRRRVSAEESRSPRQYASDIMKQVKESVSRRKTKKKDVTSPRPQPLKPKRPRSERFMEKMKKMPPVRAPPPLAANSPSPAAPPRAAAGDGEAWKSSGPSFGTEEHLYVKCVLERTGLGSGKQTWYSPAHPVDPIVFHQLERSFRRSTGKLRLRCNRKLLFNLVDEILGDILWEERWRRHHAETVEQRLWRRVRGGGGGGAAADVTSLLVADLAAGNFRRLSQLPAVCRESESVAAELVSFLLDSLVSEAVAEVMM